jgi:hypothetical protein
MVSFIKQYLTQKKLRKKLMVHRLDLELVKKNEYLDDKIKAQLVLDYLKLIRALEVHVSPKNKLTLQ